MAEIKLTTENFENEVMGSEIPVLVDFWQAGAALAACWRLCSKR